jgi:plastocyanin domain-containing protein
VTVDNGVYTPARVKIKPNTSSILTFLRKDESPCAELVLLPALDISQTLPLNKKVSIELPPLDLGEYVFHCQMQMYRGMLIVE